MKVKELLNRREKWTKGAEARNKLGNYLYVPSDSDAVCWCLSGAIKFCYQSGPEYERACRLVQSAVGFSITGWNDAHERTFKDVKKLLETLDI